MRPLTILILLALAAPLASGEEDEAWEAADRQYRASFFYSAAVSAELRGLHAEALVLYRRASEADPHSLFLLKSLADNLEVSEQDAEAKQALRQALKLAPGDTELREKLARAHMRAGELEEARKLFLDAQGKEPKDKLALRSLAAMDMAGDKWDSAAERLKRLLELHPQARDEREMYAAALVRLERKDEALAQYEQVLKEEPTRAEAAYRLSNLYEAMGREAPAVETLARAIKASPESSMLLDALARCLYRLKKYDQAEAAFSRLLDENSQDIDSLLYRGMSRLQSRKYKDAQKDFQMLGELDKDNPSQLYGLGLAQLWQGRQGEAEKSFEKLVSLHPKAVAGYTQLAFIYDRTSRTAKAVELLARGVREAPGSSELYLLLGSAYMDAREMKKAAKVFVDGIKATGNDSSLRFQLAVLYDKDGAFPKAEEELARLIQDEPKNAQALNYLGYSYVDRGQKLEEALDLICRALDVEPGNHYYQDSLGWACYKLGQFKEAKDALLKASQIKDPGQEEAIVFEHLAHVYEKLGDRKNAAVNFERAAQLRSGSAGKKTDAP